MNEIYYCVYLPYSKYVVCNLAVHTDFDIPTYPKEFGKLRICDKPEGQSEIFNNTDCAAAQMFNANSLEEVNQKVIEYQNNFSNEEWVKQNIKPIN